MKQLLIVTLLLITVGLNAQTRCVDLDGRSIPCKEDTVKIPFHAAKQIAKDLVVGDSAKAVLYQVKQELNLTTKISLQKDTIITKCKDKNTLYEDRLREKDVKFTVMETRANQLEHDNTILKRITKGIVIGASVVIALVLTLK
jgi:hypothetical protein